MTEPEKMAERLEAYAKDQGGWHNIDETCEEAAALIRRLEAENAALKAAKDDCKDLLPFAHEAGAKRASITATAELARLEAENARLAADKAKLVEALKDTLIMLERLKRHVRITENAGYSQDGRMLLMSEVEERAHAAIGKNSR
jgi:hypothetical protein